MSSQVSGRPHPAWSPPTAPRPLSPRPGRHPWTSTRSAPGRTRSTSARRGRRQRQFAPLVVAMVGDVRDAAYTRSRDGSAGPPTLLALDEVANIAPIPDLPAMVSEGAGQGLLVLACLQDLSQARARWGPAADGFLSLFGTTVVLRGIADTATLRDISALAGDREVPAVTVNRSADRWGRVRPSTSVGTKREPGLPVDAVAHGSARRRARPRPRQDGRADHAHACARALAVARAPPPGAPARPPGTRRPRPLTQRPSPRSSVSGSRHPSRTRASATCRSVRT